MEGKTTFEMGLPSLSNVLRSKGINDSDLTFLRLS